MESGVYRTLLPCMFGVAIGFVWYMVGLCAGMGLGLAVALGASNTLETLTVNQYFHMLFRVALHLKVCLQYACCLLW